MMNKRYIFSILAVALVLATGLFLRGTNQSNQKIELADPLVKEGWIEILSGKTFLIENKDGIESKKELNTGDSIVGGNTLETDSKGKAEVHFLDGSVLRVNSSTRLTIKNTEYDKNSGKFVLEATLSFGKIWSKIVELTTPDSLWKVETSNTVATVRGSAFGISFDGKTSEIFASQHKINVEVFDSATKEKMKVRPLIVGEGNILKVSDTDIEKIKDIEKRADAAAPAEREVMMKTTELIFIPGKISQEIRANDWFTENESKDKKTEEDIQKAKEETGGDSVEFKKFLNKQTEERLIEIKNHQKDLNEQRDIEEKDLINNEAVKTIETKGILKEDILIKGKVLKEIGTKKAVETAPEIVVEKWDTLKLEANIPLGDLIEGEKANFRAILSGATGVTKDVTGEVKWEVIGQMGSINNQGLFSAKLDPLISELGEANGFVVATREGINEEKIFGKSALIHVKSKIESTSESDFIGQ